jgi:hypothetical protein
LGLRHFPYRLNASLAQSAKPVPVTFETHFRELQLNRSLAAADWRQRKLLVWEISYDQDRTLQLCSLRAATLAPWRRRPPPSIDANCFCHV